MNMQKWTKGQVRLKLQPHFMISKLASVFTANQFNDCHSNNESIPEIPKKYQGLVVMMRGAKFWQIWLPKEWSNVKILENVDAWRPVRCSDRTMAAGSMVCEC